MFQLKNLINRTSVPNDPQNNAAEDFFTSVLEGYIIAAATEIMHTTAAEDDVPNGSANQLYWKASLAELAAPVVQRYVKILPDTDSTSEDMVFTYTCDVITLGLIWMNYYDATREGDGDRIMSLWKFLMIIFKKSGRTNYAKEATILLLHYHCLLSERKAAQLKHSRFINTKGRVGCNMLCDLYMEHLNHRLKGVIHHMGSNVQPPSLVRAAKAIGIVEMETQESHTVHRHSKPSSLKDVTMIVDQLIAGNVCVDIKTNDVILVLNHLKNAYYSPLTQIKLQHGWRRML